MNARDLMDLVRIPNATTAISDIVGAWVLASFVLGTSAGVSPVLILTALASVCLYLGGMALNDVADADTDARERPERPIPSGRVRRGTALGITIFLLGLGLTLAWFAGTRVFAVALVLLLAIVLYDLILAGRPVVGPWGMALCRALNLLLGLTAAGALGGVGVAALIIQTVYVFGLTHLSLGEAGGGDRRGVSVAALILAGSVLSLWALARVAAPARGLDSWLALGATTLGMLWPSALCLARAWRRPEARFIGPTIGAMVSSILWLGASFAMIGGPVSWLAVFVALGIVQFFLRRSYRVT